MAGVAALLATLAGTWLWASMLMGAADLAGGLLSAGDHLERAAKTISAGKLKEARFETLSAVAAAERARSGVGSPALDILSLSGRVADALGQAGLLVSAAEHSGDAIAGTYDIAQNSLRGKDKIVAKDPSDPKGGNLIRIERVREIGAVISQVRADLRASADDLSRVDATALPRRARPPIARGIRRAEDADALLADAEAGFKVLPGFLGADEPRRYLVGMQNSAELRGTGGAMLRFARINLDEGRFRLDTSSSVYKIDKNREPIDIPLPKDAWYVAGIPDAQRFGNSNWSPDWPLTSKLTLAYGRASKREWPRFDGVFGVDPIAMKLILPGAGIYKTGGGRRIQADKVVHLVLNKAYASEPNPGQRRQVLKGIVDGFYKALLNPDRPSELVAGIGEALGSKHMQMWLADPGERAFVKRMNWDGEIQRAKGSDYLAVVEQNVGGNKLNYFERMDNRMDVRLSDDDARVETRVEVTNEVFLPQPRYVLGAIRPEGYHRPMLNVYVPRRARLLDAGWTGERVDTSPTTELAAWTGGVPPTHFERGKKVWSATLLIPPGGAGGVHLTYRVPDVVRTEDGRRVYRLVLQRQPKVRPERATIRVVVPQGARDLLAPGFARAGEALTWKGPVKEDTVLEVSWQT